MNMQNLMAQAQKMQRDIQKKKEEIDNTEFNGTSELVNVVINGKKEILSVTIDRNVSLDKDDLEVIEDMFKIAFNDASKKVDKEIDSKLGSVGSGLGGLF